MNPTQLARPLAEYPEYMKVKDVATHANVAEETVREWLKRRWLIGWKMPGRMGEWRIRKVSPLNFKARSMNNYVPGPGEALPVGKMS